MSPPSEPTTRCRRDADLPVLAELLAEQQPTSGYPMRWPLPFAVEDFLVRADEQVAWVAELDGAVVGHVSVCPAPAAGEAGDTFRSATGCAEPAVVSVLFTAARVRGTGVGGRLLDTATAWARAQGRVPVLDVVPLHGTALAVYRHRGWEEIGSSRFGWLPDGAPDVLLLALPPLGVPVR